jgi:phosphoribosylcarboxyaminoimidazole (NCAIR) mutase
MGSHSDWDMMQHAARRLKDFGDGGQDGRRGAAFRTGDGKRWQAP